MSSIANKITDQVHTHAVRLEQYGERVVQDSLKVLRNLERELAAQVTRYDVTGVGTAYQAKRLKALLVQTRATIGQYYTKAANQHDKAMRFVALNESRMMKSLMDATIGLDLSTVALTGAQLAHLSGGTLIQGAASRTWWKRQANGLQGRFEKQMQLGVARGETLSDLVRRIRGRRENQFKDGVMSVSYSQAATLARTSNQAVANAARLETYQTNDDLIKGVMWLSTLDAKTTDICIARDFKEYTLDLKPLGHGFPWFEGPGSIHWNCRSTSVPIMKSWKELSGKGAIRTGGRPTNIQSLFQERLAAKGFTQTEIQTMQANARASMDGQIPAQMDFEAWLRTKSPAFQDELLGKGKMEAWRREQITLQELLRQSGRALSEADFAAFTKEMKTAPIIGQSSGLNKTEYFLQTLRENEVLKLADKELQALWDAEFPEATHGKRYTVREIRRKVNRGVYGDVGFTSVEYAGRDIVIIDPEVITRKPTPTTRPVGTTTGMNKTQYYLKTLQENQILQLSDAELQALWDKEFPPATHGRRYLVREIRNKVNRGAYGDVGFKSTSFADGLGTRAAIPSPPPSVEAPRYVKVNPYQAVVQNQAGDVSASLGQLPETYRQFIIASLEEQFGSAYVVAESELPAFNKRFRSLIADAYVRQYAGAQWTKSFYNGTLEYKIGKQVVKAQVATAQDIALREATVARQVEDKARLERFMKKVDREVEKIKLEIAGNAERYEALQAERASIYNMEEKLTQAQAERLDEIRVELYAIREAEQNMEATVGERLRELMKEASAAGEPLETRAKAPIQKDWNGRFTFRDNTNFLWEDGVEIGIKDFHEMVSENEALRDKLVHLRVIDPKDARGYYSGNKFVNQPGAQSFPEIHIPTRHHSFRQVTVHELGHWLEDIDKAAHVKSSRFLRERTKGYTAEAYSKKYPNELVVKDKFIDKYMGKIYSDGDTEIISMGLQYLTANPAKLYFEDREYFQLMMDVLRKGI